VHCVTVCILVFGVECLTYSNVVFMEEKVRKCSFSEILVYCLTVCILVFAVVCVT